jgi:hypothetical protein
MRRELIEALTYPRLLILKIIDAQDCEHDSLFEATSARCHQCALGRECHWVSCLNDFKDLRNKPAHTLNASLRYSVRLVESLHSELRHDATTCTCEACSWIRDSQRLIETFESSLAPNPHRPAH